MEDYKKIMVGDQPIGIVGLKRILAEVKQVSSGETDDRIGGLLLEKLSEVNYIPQGNKQVYQLAFLREYKKFIGQPVPEEPKKGLTVRVLGQGCPLCKRLSNDIMQIIAENNIACDFEHVTDLQEIASHGIYTTPALIINQQVKATGNVPSKNKLESWLREAAK